MKTVLTIAGSDASGGAGIQADIKTITAHGLYASSVITALTAQNTMGVSMIESVSPKMIEKQLESVFEDIYPDAVKIGMVDKTETIEAIAVMLEKYKPKQVVLDTVMVSSTGKALLQEEAVEALVKRLLPLAQMITPNIPEAEVLSGMKITNRQERILAAEKIAQSYWGAILIKGGHGIEDADDLLYEMGKTTWFQGERVENPNTHGTGCTLSSAIACNLAQGYSLEESIKRSKAYITGALKAGLNLGHGCGPLNHMWQQA